MYIDIYIYIYIYINIYIYNGVPPIRPVKWCQHWTVLTLRLHLPARQLYVALSLSRMALLSYRIVLNLYMMLFPIYHLYEYNIILLN